MHAFFDFTAEAAMAVSGYASASSVLPGGTIEFHLSSTVPGNTPLAVERIGLTPLAARFDARLATHAVPASRAWEGYGWPAAASFTVPPSWPSGLYRLAHEGASVLTFVVRAAKPGAASRVLLHVSFLTPAAYSNAGGKSLYGYNSLPAMDEASRAARVSLDRPGSAPGSDNYEARLIRWLEDEDIAIEYCASSDLHADPQLLGAYDCLLIAGHDEYWTHAMREHVERFVADGGNLVVMSGNTCHRAVRLEDGGRTVAFHKYAGDDPHPNAHEATVAWAAPPLNRPQQTLLGAGFTDGAYGGAATAYTIRLPSHWALAGVSAAATSPFMVYEADAAEYVDEPEGYPRVTGAEGTPRAFTLLATADLRGWDGKPGRATMGVFSRHGTVFNGATTEWVNVLGIDPVITQITRNVLNRLRRRVPWDWEAIGHAPRAGALAALDHKLFMATRDNRLLRRHPVGAEVPWRDIGHATGVMAMAGSGDTLFCATSDNRLWWRAPLEADTPWAPIGTGPARGTRALAAAGGMLYAVDGAGGLWRAPARRAAPAWVPQRFAADATVNSMASYGDILFAATTDHRLLRTNRDWIVESDGWHAVHHCNFAVGLAVVEWMLFVATTEGRLWRLDLHGLRRP